MRTAEPGPFRSELLQKAVPEFNLLFFIAVQLAVVLLIICGFLIYHMGRQRGLIKKLEERIIDLRESLSVSHADVKSAQQELSSQQQTMTKDFVECLDDEIDSTVEYHQELNPTQDIVLDIALDSPLERQATALRYAFLIAEKEARYAGEEGVSSWQVLQTKLQQIVQFYESAAAAVPESGNDELDKLEEILGSVTDPDIELPATINGMDTEERRPQDS